MCWNIRIGRCSHPEPRPDLIRNPAVCKCNQYITTWDPTPCGPCNDFLVESSISQADFIDVQMYNRNITYFLQTTNEFGIKYEHPPANIGDWVALPHHVRFTVNDEGILGEGAGIESIESLADGTSGPPGPDEDDGSDSNSTLVGSDSSSVSESSHNDVLGVIMEEPTLPVIQEEEAEANA
ncbi:hypothetical protein TWF718_005344 [Orbilia javanica]|uniref:Uncharacterized protein n=1 Tax=Orbilia javanica TaxID=47235 RepID=A0AAN8N3G1_9PEZI